VSIVPDEEKGVLIHLDRSKVLTVGVPAIEAYLRKIQVYKSTADYAAYVLREKTIFFKDCRFADHMKPIAHSKAKRCGAGLSPVLRFAY
jgi:dipeptidyl-peptidase-3